MNPDLLLTIVAALTGFVLKTALAFGICLVFSSFVDSPNPRFVVWLSFLYGVAGYWLWLANGILAGGQPSAIAPRPLVQAVSSSVGSWQIPGAWAFPLEVALRVIGIVYLLVLSYILLTYIKKQRRLKWVLGFTCKPPVEIAEAFQRLAESLHVRRSRLLILSGAASPATFGWIRPTILLPDVCLEQGRSEVADILRHELHHVRRWDSVWNGFAMACRALLFFHPVAWYAVRKMQFDRELACDLAVVSDSPGRRVSYAECLVHFARLNSSQDPKTWGIDFAASSEHLKARVQSILAGSKRPSIWLLCLRTAGGLALLAGFLAVAPSLAVLLSYAHEQTSQSLMSASHAPHSGVESEIRATRKGRLSVTPAPMSANAAVAILSHAETGQLAQPTPDSTYREGEGTPSIPTGPGPRLLRRPLPSATSGNTGVRQQSVAILDPGAATQIDKNGSRGSGNALQQSATAAAGIYKRLSALDRH